eukprot:11220256-Lingulodinium_polyedra.AAC.1
MPCAPPPSPPRVDVQAWLREWAAGAIRREGRWQGSEECPLEERAAAFALRDVFGCAPDGLTRRFGQWLTRH